MGIRHQVPGIAQNLVGAAMQAQALSCTPILFAVSPYDRCLVGADGAPLCDAVRCGAVRCMWRFNVHGSSVLVPPILILITSVMLPV